MREGCDILRPVSYTHLDVYKRQSIFCGLIQRPVSDDYGKAQRKTADGIIGNGGGFTLEFLCDSYRFRSKLHVLARDAAHVDGDSIILNFGILCAILRLSLIHI